MQAIWIFRHIECEGPGYLGRFLDRENIPYRIIAIDKNEPVPTDLKGVTGLVFMGGSMSVNDPNDWIQYELDLIRIAEQQGIPVLGHCLGGQLISKALGAIVKPNPVREIGWHAVEKIPGRETDEWLGDIHFPVELFHWHGETFELPQDVTPLFKSRFCDNQAYVKNNILAMQCHVEMLPEMVIEWADMCPGEIAEAGDSVQSKAQMIENLEQRITAAQKVADVLYKKWLSAD
jgi:GMP synthase-like glutamine amidotransferase